jgi:hypothetical protein
MPVIFFHSTLIASNRCHNLQKVSYTYLPITETYQWHIVKDWDGSTVYLYLLGKVENWTLVKFKSGLWGTGLMDR